MLTAEEKALEDLYFDKKFACKALFEEGKYEEAWKLCLDTFEIFPEPRYEQPLVYLLVEDIVKYSIKLKQYEYGNQYAPLLLVTGLGRADDGARESLIGKLAYDQGNMVTARQFLIIAYRKDTHKMFFKGKDDKKYKDFAEEAIKGKKKTSVAPKSKKAAKEGENVKQIVTAEPGSAKAMKQVQDLIQEGNTLFDSKKMKAAREKFEAALELVPEPKGSHYDATWLNAAIGDTYIQENDSETALEYFTEAYYGIQGQLNPYVVYMMGKCNFELGNEEDAKKYFRLAHELDKAVFDEDKGRFLEFI